MIDLTTVKGRIVATALRLAGERNWSEVSQRDIAEAAGMTLADVRGEFATKGAMLAEFARQVNAELMRRAPKRGEGQTARDAIFDAMMSRFDLLVPYRSALKSVMRSGLPEPELLKSLFEAQAAILESAGVSADGVGGAVRTAGLASVYASVFRTWLDDDDPGLARTMAALDRRLRRGEQTLASIEGFCTQACRMVSVFRPGSRKSDVPASGDTASPAAPAT